MSSRDTSCRTAPARSTPRITVKDLVVFLGPDRHGVPLEVMAVELAGGDLLVIHAMKLRRTYLDAYREVMECLET